MPKRGRPSQSGKPPIRIIDAGGERSVGIAVACPVGCGRRVKRLVHRFGRLGCMTCQRCYLASVRNKSIRDAVARLEAFGTPAALSERALILLAGME